MKAHMGCAVSFKFFADVKRVMGVGLMAGVMLMPLLAQAGEFKWSNSGDGNWQDGVNWIGGVAPGGNTDVVLITNELSKTVTINSSTPAGNLVISNIYVYAMNGATNTLRVAGNTTPLWIRGPAYDKNVVGGSAGRVGKLVLDNGTIVATNEFPTGYQTNGGFTVGVGDAGFIVISNNSSLLVNQIRMGTAAGGVGSITLHDGTWEVSGGYLRYGFVAGGTGTVTIAGGHFITTNASEIAPGFFSHGIINMTGGRWDAKDLSVASSANLGYGEFNMSGGTGVFASGISGGLASRTNAAAINISGGLLQLATNRLQITVGTLTLSGGRVEGYWIGGNGGVSPVRSRVIVSGGTNIFAGSSAGGNAHYFDGDTLISGGFLMTSNATATSVGQNSAGARMVVSNGTWIVPGYLRIGLNKSDEILTIAGGEVIAGIVQHTYSSEPCSSNLLLITGGILECNSHVFTYSAAHDNITSNSGGVFQFTTNKPTFTINGANSAVVLNGGTFSFRGIADVDVKGNWSGTDLTKITYTDGGQNAFRLNNASNTTSSQDYTFATGLGATNYMRLELVNGGACYRGGNVTVGTGGTILFSNTTARLEGDLTVTNAGVMRLANGSVTVTGACTLRENTVIVATTNAAASLVTVNGTLTLPTSASFTLNTSIARDTQVTLFSSDVDIVGTPGNWTVSPATHRLQKVGNTVVLAPRTAGFVIKVK